MQCQELFINKRMNIKQREQGVVQYKENAVSIYTNERSSTSK